MQSRIPEAEGLQSEIEVDMDETWTSVRIASELRNAQGARLTFKRSIRSQNDCQTETSTLSQSLHSRNLHIEEGFCKFDTDSIICWTTSNLP